MMTLITLMYNLWQPKQIRILQLLAWSMLISITTCWFGFRALQAEVTTREGTAESMSITGVQSTEAHAIGSKVTFVFTITNPTENWLSIMPVSATFDSSYVAWVNGTPPPTALYPEAIEWADLTEIIGDVPPGLPPGQGAPMTLTFQALSTTTHLPGGVTEIHILMHDAKADPDGPGPAEGEISLPDLTFDLSVAIQGDALPPAIPQGIARSTDAVTVAWQTSDESDISGFNLVRVYESGTRQQVNQTFLVAEYAGEPSGTEYVVVDSEFLLLEAVAYELEIEPISGGRPITAGLGTLPGVSIIISPTDVELTAQGITPYWQTSDETYMVGFDLLRYDLPSEPITLVAEITDSEPVLTQINDSLIPANHSGYANGGAYYIADYKSRIGGGGGYGYKLRTLLQSGEILTVEIGIQNPIQIALASHAVELAQSGTQIQWLTLDELLITGFHLWRTDNDGNETRLNAGVIDAKEGGFPLDAQYNFTYPTPDPDKSYVYTLEILLVDQSTVRHELGRIAATQRVFLPMVRN